MTSLVAWLLPFENLSDGAWRGHNYPRKLRLLCARNIFLSWPIENIIFGLETYVPTVK